MKDIDSGSIATLLVTVFVPPVGVALKTGFGGHFWLNLVLTVFGFYVAGLVHGLFVVLRD